MWINPESASQLCYGENNFKKVFLKENFYVSMTFKIYSYIYIYTSRNTIKSEIISK